MTRAAIALAFVAFASSLAHARLEPPADAPAPAELQPAPPPATIAPPVVRAQADARFTLAPPRLVAPIAGHAERTAGLWLFGVSGAHLAGAIAATMFAVFDRCAPGTYYEICGPQFGAAIFAIGFGSAALLTLIPAIPLYTVGAVKGHRARNEIKLSLVGPGVNVTF